MIEIGQPRCTDCDARKEWLGGGWVCLQCFLEGR